MLLQLALRNARRNVRRTLLTASTVMIGVALFTLGVSWMTGVFGDMIRLYTDSAGEVVVVDAEWAAKEDLQPTYANLPDADALLEKVRAVEGVAGAEARIAVGVVVTADDEIGDHFTRVMGASPGYYQRWDGPGKVVKGTWLTGAANEVVLGRKVATEIDADLGTEVLLLGQTQYGSMSPMTAKVVGVAGGDAATDQGAYVRLEDAQWLVDLPGGALELLVWSDAPDNEAVLAVAGRVDALPEMEELVVTAWFAKEPWNSMLPMIDGMQAFLGGLIVFVTALAIFNTMTMSVLERTAEIGVLRAMGLTRAQALRIFVTEALLIGLVGGALGAVLGGSAALYMETHGFTLGEKLTEKMGTNFPVVSTFYADLTPGILVAAVVLGLVIAGAGALLPALRATTIQPISAMQSKR